MKTLISIILTITLLCTISISQSASSFAAIRKGDFEYKVMKSGTAKINYRGKGKNLVIPETIDGFTVTYFDLNFNEEITSLTIPSTLRILDDFAFSDCENLKTVNIENGIKKISYCAFDGCTSLSEIALPESVKTIGEGAFQDCTSLESVTLGNNVKTIGYEAFYGCTKLSDINIPDSVYNIGDAAFDDTLWYKKQPDGMVFAGKNLYDFKGKCPKKIIIPDGTKSICSEAFYMRTNLSEVIIPDSVIHIKNSAFLYCENLETVSLGNNIKTIGYEAFSCCNKLTEFTIPDSVVNLGYGVFRYCENLRTVSIGKNAKITRTSYADSSVFSICSKLEKITVDKENKYLSSKGGVLFNKDQTELITYPHAKSTTYKIPKGVKKIGTGAFYQCYSLKKVTIPKGVKEIGANAFNWTSLKKVTFPNSLEIIREGAFNGCRKLKTLTIPKNIKKIEGMAFANCKNLEKVNFNAKECKLSLYEYEWDTDHSWIFDGNKKLTTITIGRNVKNIPKDLFYDVIALNLKKIVISKKTKTISHEAFNHSDRFKKWVAHDSSNINIIRVSKKGDLNLASKGTAKITFKNIDTNKKKSVTFVVTS